MGKNQPVPEPVGPPPTELEQIRMTTNHVQNEVSRSFSNLITDLKVSFTMIWIN